MSLVIKRTCSTDAIKAVNYKLTYFNGRGSAEHIRYIFHYCQVEFEDFRIDWSEWPKYKMKMPLRQMPTLDITWSNNDTVTITQSATLVRLLGNLFNINGNSVIDRIRCDEAFEILRDVSWLMNLARHTKNEATSQKRYDLLLKDSIPRNFGYLEKMAKQNNGKSLVGNGEKLTYADLTLAVHLDNMSRNYMIDYNGLQAKYPSLSNIRKLVEQSPGIQNYLKIRPDTKH